MTEVKNSSLDLLTRQMSGSRKRDEKTVDDFSGFKNMLKSRNQKEDSRASEYSEAGEETKTGAEETAAAIMAAGMQEVRNGDDTPLLKEQTAVQGLEETGVQRLEILAVLSEDSGEVQTVNPFQSLDQFRFQKLAENAAGMNSAEEGKTAVITEGAEEMLEMGPAGEPEVQGTGKKKEALEPGVLGQSGAVASEEEKTPLADRLMQRISEPVSDSTGEKTEVTVQSGKTKEKQNSAGEEKTDQENILGAFREKSYEPDRTLNIRTDKDGVTYTTVNLENLKDLEAKLSEQMLKQVQTGKNDLEVQLEPYNLGKIRIKFSYEDNQVSVSVLCTESNTLKLLSQSAGELGTILESNLERPVQIFVDKQETDYLNNQQEQQGGRQDRQEQQGNRQEDSREDFIQKLRLGIYETDRADGMDTDYR
ncbi:flagellar hook-length control protein FliK [Lachnospiraceae bacterium 54-53]